MTVLLTFSAYIKFKEDIPEMSKKAYETSLAFREEAVAMKAVRLYNRIIVADEETGGIMCAKCT